MKKLFLLLICFSSFVFADKQLDKIMEPDQSLNSKYRMDIDTLIFLAKRQREQQIKEAIEKNSNKYTIVTNVKVKN